MKRILLAVVLVAITAEIVRARPQRRSPGHHEHHRKNQHIRKFEEIKSTMLSPCLQEVKQFSSHKTEFFSFALNSLYQYPENLPVDAPSYCVHTAKWAKGLLTLSDKGVTVPTSTTAKEVEYSGSGKAGIARLRQKIKDACQPNTKTTFKSGKKFVTTSYNNIVVDLLLVSLFGKAMHNFAIEVTDSVIQIWSSSNIGDKSRDPQDGYTIFEWIEGSNEFSGALSCDSLGQKNSVIEKFLTGLAEITQRPLVPMDKMIAYFPVCDSHGSLEDQMKTLASWIEARVIEMPQIFSDPEMSNLFPDVTNLKSQTYKKDGSERKRHYFATDYQSKVLGAKTFALDYETLSDLCSAYDLWYTDLEKNPHGIQTRLVSLKSPVTDDKCISDAKALLGKESLSQAEMTKKYFTLFSPDGDGSKFASSQNDYGLSYNPQDWYAFDLSFWVRHTTPTNCVAKLKTELQSIH